ncbi:MAG: hypothetical protein M3077_05735 [Candidatus Dormibacteraeota bacterium]|nr:hypothetical protein [Candidatus Dormibacteraeota bacterium]
MDAETLDLTDDERQLVNPMVSRVAELKAAVRADDPSSQARLIHATGRVQGRVDAVVLARGLNTSDWRLYHQTDGTWYVARIKRGMPPPSPPDAAAAASGTPIYRAPVDKGLRRRAISAASVARDLEFLGVILERLIELIEDGSDDFVLKQALFSAALVAYVRTRNPDRRQGYWITDDLVANCADEKLDDFVKGVRDKYIAHSINAFEQTDLGVIVDDHAIRGTVITHVALTGWESSDLKRLLALTQCLSKRVEKDLDDFQDAADAAARAMPITDVERGDPIGFQAPSPAELRTPRRDG